MNDIIRAFFEQSAAGRGFRRSQRRWDAGLIIFAMAAFGLSVWSAFQPLWFGFHTGIWQTHLAQAAQIMQVLPVGALLLNFLSSQRFEHVMSERSDPLRAAQAAANRTDERATLAPTTAEEALAPDAHALRLATPVGAQVTVFSLYAALCAFMGLGSLCLAIGALFWLSSNGDGLSRLQEIVLSGLGVIGIGLLWATAAAVRLVRRFRRAAWFTMDEIGVRIEGASPGDARSIAWGEARSFYSFGLKAYALDSGQCLLMWARPSGRASADHDELMHQITARTGLKLHALDQEAQRIAKRAEKFGWTRGIKLTVMAMLAVMLLWPIGWVAPRIQAWQFQGLVARIHAERPLYQTSLTADDGQWQLAGGESPAGSFSPAGFTVLGTSKNPFAIAESRQRYTDAAIEVTMRQIGATDRGATIGFILRGELGDPEAVDITISQTGEWYANDFDSSSSGPYTPYYALGHNAAIRTGADAVNMLLVLMRGPQYLIFVNGQFVGAYYHAPAHAAPISLRGDTFVAQGGQFSDLTIYPAIYN